MANPLLNAPDAEEQRKAQQQALPRPPLAQTAADLARESAARVGRDVASAVPQTLKDAYQQGGVGGAAGRALREGVIEPGAALLDAGALVAGRAARNVAGNVADFGRNFYAELTGAPTLPAPGPAARTAAQSPPEAQAQAVQAAQAAEGKPGEKKGEAKTVPDRVDQLAQLTGPDGQKSYFTSAEAANGKRALLEQGASRLAAAPLAVTGAQDVTPPAPATPKLPAPNGNRQPQPGDIEIIRGTTRTVTNPGITPGVEYAPGYPEDAGRAIADLQAQGRAIRSAKPRTGYDATRDALERAAGGVAAEQTLSAQSRLPGPADAKGRYSVEKIKGDGFEAGEQGYVFDSATGKREPIDAQRSASGGGTFANLTQEQFDAIAQEWKSATGTPAGSPQFLQWLENHLRQNGEEKP